MSAWQVRISASSVLSVALDGDGSRLRRPFESPTHSPPQETNTEVVTEGCVNVIGQAARRVWAERTPSGGKTGRHFCVSCPPLSVRFFEESEIGGSSSRRAVCMATLIASEPIPGGVRIKNCRGLVRASHPGPSLWPSSTTRFAAWKRTTRHGRYAMNGIVDQFLQECPVCGRPLQVSSNLNGRRVTCLHCGGRFLASYPVAGSLSPTSGASFLLQRAEELIGMASRRVELCAAGAAGQNASLPSVSNLRLQSEFRPEGRTVGTLWRDLRRFKRFGR